MALDGLCKATYSVSHNGVCSNFEGWHQPTLCQQGLACTMTKQQYVAPNGKADPVAFFWKISSRTILSVG